jgi:hypothetical protein
VLLVFTRLKKKSKRKDKKKLKRCKRNMLSLSRTKQRSGVALALLSEEALKPQAVHERSEAERGGSEERLKAEDKRAIDLLRTSSGSASSDGGGAEPH